MNPILLLLMSSVAAEFGVWKPQSYCVEDQYLIAVQHSYYEGYNQPMCESLCKDGMMAGMATRTYDGRNSFCCSFRGLQEGMVRCELYEGYDMAQVGIQDRQEEVNAAFTFGVFEVEGASVTRTAAALAMLAIFAINY